METGRCRATAQFHNEVLFLPMKTDAQMISAVQYANTHMLSHYRWDKCVSDFFVRKKANCFSETSGMVLNSICKVKKDEWAWTFVWVPLAKCSNLNRRDWGLMFCKTCRQTANKLARETLSLTLAGSYWYHGPTLNLARRKYSHEKILCPNTHLLWGKHEGCK